MKDCVNLITFISYLSIEGASVTDEELDTLVDEYLDSAADGEEEELKPFASQRTLEAAIRLAVACKDATGRHFDHQFRIRRSVYPQALRNLLAAVDDLRAASTFDDLLMIVERAFLEIKWAGELYVYDTAFRIGAKRNLRPEFVYLHAGTRAGAMALRFDGKLQKIPLSSFPKPLQRLKPWQLESFLCVRATELVRRQE